MARDVDDEFEAFKRKAQQEYDAFKANAASEYEQFRRQANEEFANFMARPWTPTELRKGEKTPVRPSPAPVFAEPDDVPETPEQPIEIKERLDIPEPTPQPQPVEPIHRIPVEDSTTPKPIAEEESPKKFVTLDFYGTACRFNAGDVKGFRLRGNTGKDFADGWRQLNTDITNDLIVDCLYQRDNLNLCDWAYLQLIDEVAGKICSSKNEKTLLTGFVFCQSGYKMRFARSKDGMLHLFYAPKGLVYNTPRLFYKGEWYYLFGKQSNPDTAYEICDFSFPREQNLSFEITKLPRFAYAPSKQRNVKAQHYPDVDCRVSLNENLINFYNSYPDATLTMNPDSKWAIHANTPVSPQLKEYLYPNLEAAIKGKGQLDAANILINFAESFPYGYDDEIWGWDRAFFPDESWYYPKSDCEDHAIHFTRLVRDLMGLDAALVLYPDHLAAAVAFTEDVPGDFVMSKGKRYTICDPTIFYAGVGHTMQGMDNQKAVLIELRK